MKNHLADDVDHFPNTVSRDLAHFLLGEELGEGRDRVVYTYLPYPDGYVMKVEDRAGSFQNVLEWEIWNNVKDLPHIAKWLAPVRRISDNGVYLLQERTTPAKKFPDKVPAFFKDTKRANFGMLNGKFVCHDYGTFITEDIYFSKVLVKSEWWDESDD